MVDSSNEKRHFKRDVGSVGHCTQHTLMSKEGVDRYEYSNLEYELVEEEKCWVDAATDVFWSGAVAAADAGGKVPALQHLSTQLCPPVPQKTFQGFCPGNFLTKNSQESTCPESGIAKRF